MGMTITRSVGRAGTNLAADVRVIQEMLRQANQEAGEAGLDPGPANGVCSEQTMRAIEVFQGRFSRRTDGRIDPDGATLRRLRQVTYNDGGSCQPGQLSARALVSKLLPHIGERYVFGAAVPKQNPNWAGPWDCAEFVAWGIYQVSGRLVGCRNGRAPNGRYYDNAYTGYFAADLPAVATQVTAEEAADTIGAIALRSPGNPGHIAVSRGNDETIEAASTAEGVKCKKIKGRGWTSFWKLNFLVYDNASAAM